MEPLQKHKRTVKAMEVLYVESAMLEKSKGGMTSFATMGPLSVLYFKRYDRFVLRLNDWMYPLMRRLPIMTLEKGEMNEASYLMPAMNGFIYKLRIMGDPNPNLVSNLESILSRNSRFANNTGEMPSQKMEMMSPDDKVIRQMTMDTEPTGMMMDKPSMGMKMTQEMLKNMSMKKRMMSRKKKMDLRKIENKDWRKEAKSRIRTYFETTGKVTQEFMNLRRNNSNLTQAKEYDQLKNVSDSKLPVLYIKREEIEEVILTHKDMTDQGDYDFSQMMTEQIEKKREEMLKEQQGGIINYLWSGLTGITQYIFGRSTNTSPSPASKEPTEAHDNVTTVSENKQGQPEESEGPIGEAVKMMAEQCHLKDMMMKDQMPSKPMSGSKMSMDMQRKPMEKNSKEMRSNEMNGKMTAGMEH